MDFNLLLEKVSKINNYINLNHKERTENEKILLKAVKIPEEVGELYNEILLFLNFSRVGKNSFDKENLEKELADVILSTLVLSNSLGVDIEKALNNKINIIYNRFNLS